MEAMTAEMKSTVSVTAAEYSGVDGNVLTSLITPTSLCLPLTVAAIPIRYDSDEHRYGTISQFKRKDIPKSVNQ